MDNPPLYTLPLFGPPQLLKRGRSVKVPLKGLALLYYLALEGPTSRALLADLLYGHAQGLNNLRVELHRLKEALGRPLFPEGQDPLALPGWIALEAQGEGEILEGLEALPGLSDWVLERRFTPPAPPPDRAGLLKELILLRPPALLVLLGSQASGRKELAQALAEALGLPFHLGMGQGGLRYLEAPFPPGAEAILKDHKTFYVLGVDPGEDPRFLLELRAHYPAERMRVVPLKPLSFGEAWQGVLRGLPFHEAGRIYLEGGGEPEAMRELLQAPGLPQRTLAQLKLRARYLSQPAREALERLSIQPGPIPQALLQALEALPHLEELERKGWLFHREGWRFTREWERRLLYRTLPPGQRAKLHALAALALALAGLPLLELYHRQQGGGEVKDLLPLLPKEARLALAPGPPPPEGRVGLGPEQALCPEGEKGLEADGEGWVASLLEPGETALLDLGLLEAGVLVLSGQAAFLEPGPRLRLQTPRAQALLSVGAEATFEGGLFLLPLLPTFLHRFLLPRGWVRLWVEGPGVVAFRLKLHRPRPGPLPAYPLAAAQEVEEKGEDQGKEEGGG
ncbi:hypothetical protein [Thermus sp.]|uniref:hypothetical protein n=1 Tax=Thermus sp. TaxID=275 RepID=UPI00307EA9F6